jgi:hypothetical protein
MLGTIAALPLIAATAAAALPAADPIADVLRLERLGEAMNGMGYSDDQWDNWHDEMSSAYQRVLDLPVTPANATAKARAVWAICGGKAEIALPNSTTTSDRLMWQVIQGLAQQGAR